MKHHYLKCEKPYYEHVLKGFKKFEVRKNDRDYTVGDFIHLREVENGIETGRDMPPLQIRYVLTGGIFGINDGYCVMCWENVIRERNVAIDSFKLIGKDAAPSANDKE